ncbi:DUF2956 domain-containing protein [Shewanella youngdeokensis]|uniref:DUF2956 domain-containing protein n=1 Tax=Shewanella youngdeokensis TaxID=2999068 RepID=A0ABZ0K009_9GAMM|nr:DUF2956 domain-containing protein [Shewanella sp. DAU334]
MAQPISSETKNDALKVAKSTQKPGQSKEQTKLIALGIEKGIAEYKKQQKNKARIRDKQKKQQARAKAKASTNELNSAETSQQGTNMAYLPWGLLILSWIGFICYSVIGN